ncbi:hypothetical protein AAG747_00515 [Rapidithrix thailandica]|uniref:Uncharacterized protein n=1 Tax=Rapidithrix thailandica TaxID=413964 RepID=A0AAW9RY53_9BACT
MAKERSDALFHLIKSLKKSEKRYFKLTIGYEDKSKDPKFLRLFELLDKQTVLSEESLLLQEPSIKKEQLSNLKAHLYLKILHCLKMYHEAKVPDIEIRELVNYAEILYNRCLYEQCVQILKKAKKRAIRNDNLELLLEILKWEKKVLGHTIAKDNQKRVNKIIEEVNDVNQRINTINSFSNLAVKLNSYYLKVGYIRNKSEYERVQRIFQTELPEYSEEQLSFTEKLHLYDLLVGYYFFLQDFEQGYHYAKKWVALYGQTQDLIISHLSLYIKGINNLMIAQYRLWKYYEFVDTNKKLKAIKRLPKVTLNENIQVKLFKYTYVHEFNRYFMLGDFDKGVALMNKIKSNLEVYINQLDRHSRLIMYYKIACLYFGSDHHREVVFWLNKIINTPEIDIREDIHCFARILNLVSHYELDNMDVIEYYIRSTYRFLLKKDDLHFYQKYILNFLKHLNKNMTQEELIRHFQQLREQLIPLTKSKFDKRPFIYFDIISWLESKIQNRRVQEVIREKALQRIYLEAEAF